MNKKSLALKYGVLFCIVSVVLFVANHSYKQQQTTLQLQKEIQHVKMAYKSVIEEHQKLSELIFFNDLLYDDKVVESFKQATHHLKQEQQQLYEYLKQKFFYYKSYGVKNISFYFPNNVLFLTMDDKANPIEHTVQKKSLIFANSTLKEMSSIEIANNKASLVVTKPLFDNDLKHIGAIEFELSLDYLANMVEKKTEYDIFFLYDKKMQAHSASNEFSDFLINNKYAIENSTHKIFRYKEEMMQLIASQQQEKIVKNMNTQQEFAVPFEFEKRVQAMVFIPLQHALTNEHNLYLMGYSMNEESELDVIEQMSYWILWISLSVAFLVILVIFISHLDRIRTQALRKKYDDLVNAIDKYVIMIETDKSGFITYITEAFCNIAGYSKNELIGRNINVLRHPDMSKKFFENMWYELRTKKRWEGEVKNRDKNGNSYWVRGIILPKYDINNEIIGYTSIRVNITDAKQLKKINNLLKEDLSNKLNEIKMRDETLMQKTRIILMGKILDSVSHQWKTPMSNITIELANLKARIENESLDLTQLKMIQEEIEYQLKTLSITLNEFKTFFSEENDSDKFNVYSAVNESIALVKKECQLHNIFIELNASKEIFCFGVFNDLRQIITNLLRNSVHQLIVNNIEKGAIKLNIIEEGKEVIIMCEDNAKGTSKRIIDEVFSDSYEEKVNKDAGINLFIVKLLIQKIGAQLLFENKEDKTIFYIKLVKRDRRKEKRD
ncbi:PAS domain-containing sensor histidine kinase [Candidatus Marinarcus aquaticus]|uniref:histidine kinase n=1 Tax=Candidatus Marinarcus aquaticus TaxID=2044504 RepID=A0A4Q0XTQ0_9BACT|nr:PAS domain-containing sensor histidine kinase [Candidatus Marinarcus aquaticus]RXJ57533.1 hypothetical protein CRV04_06900 [Candidatus Marinarcus aquaticus]